MLSLAGRVTACSLCSLRLVAGGRINAQGTMALYTIACATLLLSPADRHQRYGCTSFELSKID